LIARRVESQGMIRGFHWLRFGCAAGSDDINCPERCCALGTQQGENDNPGT
jgi:hypothetical protein